MFYAKISIMESYAEIYINFVLSSFGKATQQGKWYRMLALWPHNKRKS